MLLKNFLRRGCIQAINSSKCNSSTSIACKRNLRQSAICLGVKGTEIKMPVLSPTMTEGKIVKWYKKEGDVINPGDVICEVQTDKAIVAMEMDEEGILAKILKNEESSIVKIGELIALMVESDENWKDVEMPEITESNVNTEKLKNNQSKEKINHLKNNKQSDRISPSVRNLLEQYNLNLSQISATGPHNIVLKSDVLDYVSKNKIQPSNLILEANKINLIDQKVANQQSKNKKSNQPETVKVLSNNDYIDLELSSMRRTIAKRLTQSKTTIPHSYMEVICNVNKLAQYRNLLKQNGTPVSVNDIIIKATALALKKVPEINAIFNDETQSDQLCDTVDISIAVATENGLITPIIKNANQLSVIEINDRVKALAKKAREGKLQPNEFIGGSFSISNLGMFDISEFSAVINPPQCAIMAIGSSKTIVRSLKHIDQIVTCTLSYDCRIVDEEIVAKFLEFYKDYVENPELLDTSGDGSNFKRLSFFC